MCPNIKNDPFDIFSRNFICGLNINKEGPFKLPLKILRVFVTLQDHIEEQPFRHMAK